MTEYRSEIDVPAGEKIAVHRFVLDVPERIPKTRRAVMRDQIADLRTAKT